MTLGQLIRWLKSHDPDTVVKDGFGSPHSDGGDYFKLAFTPMSEAKIKDMLAYALSAKKRTFEGWKGGEYRMDEWSTVRIGEWGSVGEDITRITLKYWELTAR